VQAFPLTNEKARISSQVPRKALFTLPAQGTRRTYAVSADGRRFLIAKPLEENAAEPITVVLNWQAGLKKYRRQDMGLRRFRLSAFGFREENLGVE
jgi:hypothetical protein